MEMNQRCLGPTKSKTSVVDPPPPLGDEFPFLRIVELFERSLSWLDRKPPGSTGRTM